MQQIQWAPRVERDLIYRLYQSDAAGMPDQKLLDEVGYGLLARAQSVLIANRLHLEKTLACPRCEKLLHQQSDLFQCECGFTSDAEPLHRSYKNKQLIGPTIVPYTEAFMRDWHRALGDPRKQMRAIDDLIHRFHLELTETPTRPAAMNFIEGKLYDVKHLILSLAGEEENAARWRTNNEKAVARWGVVRGDEQG